MLEARLPRFPTAERGPPAGPLDEGVRPGSTSRGPPRGNQPPSGQHTRPGGGTRIHGLLENEEGNELSPVRRNVPARVEGQGGEESASEGSLTLRAASPQRWYRVFTDQPCDVYLVASALVHLGPLLSEPIRTGEITAVGVDPDPAAPFSGLFLKIRQTPAGQKLLADLREFAPNQFRSFGVKATGIATDDNLLIMNVNDFIGYFERATDPSLPEYDSSEAPDSPRASPSPPGASTRGTRNTRGIERIKEQRKTRIRKCRRDLQKIVNSPGKKGGPEAHRVVNEIRRERNLWRQRILSLGGSEREAEAGFSDEFRGLIAQAGGAL